MFTRLEVLQLIAIQTAFIGIAAIGLIWLDNKIQKIRHKGDK